MTDFISIVIPTYNRLHSLRLCLASIWRSSQPVSQFEVVVVDDGSRDGTQSFLDEERGQHPNLVVLRQTNKGQAAARNWGARHAKGRILAFTDDDCLVRPEWINAIQHHFSSTNVLGSEGPVIGMSAPEGISPFVHYIHQTKGPGYLTCNLAVRREAFEQVGGFDERFRMHEDTDLCLRILRKGKISFNPDMIVEHPPRPYSLLPGLWNASIYAKHYVQSEYLLYLRNPAQYQAVRFRSNFQKTFNALALKYTWLFSKKPFSRIRAYPLDFAKLVLLNIVRHAFIVLWYARTRVCPPFGPDSDWQIETN